MIPASWSLTLDPAARRTDGGRVLLGGAPFRVMTLTEAGARWLDRVTSGEPVGTSEGERQLAQRLVDAAIANPVPTAGDGPSLRDVAVVIPVRDMRDGLSTTLASIGDVGEVIVVDDGSHTPVDVEAIVLRNERSLGPGAARERGWRHTSLPFVAFVDAEIAASDTDWLAALLPHFADPRVAAVAPRVRARQDDAPAWLAHYEQHRSSLDLGPEASVVRPGARVPYVPTAALVVRREALDSVDGFDASMRVGEDVDLVWRLHEAGWSVRYEPSVEVTHPTRATLGQWLRQRVAYGASAAALAERHGDAAAPLRTSGWSALMWGLAIGGLPVLGAGVGAATTVALTPKLHGLEHPAREAWRIAGKGNLWAATSVADAVRRPWWPLALLLALVNKRSRLPVLAAFALPIVVTKPRRFGLLRLLDDMAYGVGVWLGCRRARSIRALLPAFTGPVGRPYPGVSRLARHE